MCIVFICFNLVKSFFSDDFGKLYDLIQEHMDYVAYGNFEKTT